MDDGTTFTIVKNKQHRYYGVSEEKEPRPFSVSRLCGVPRAAPLAAPQPPSPTPPRLPARAVQVQHVPQGQRQEPEGRHAELHAARRQ